MTPGPDSALSGSVHALVNKSSTGAGPTVQLGGAFSTFVVQGWCATGGSTKARVSLEGCLSTASGWMTLTTLSDKPRDMPRGNNRAHEGRGDHNDTTTTAARTTTTVFQRSSGTSQWARQQSAIRIEAGPKSQRGSWTSLLVDISTTESYGPKC